MKTLFERYNNAHRRVAETTYEIRNAADKHGLGSKEEKTAQKKNNAALKSFYLLEDEVELACNFWEKHKTLNK